MNFIVVIAALIATLNCAFADDPKNLRFGVLAFRSKEMTAKQWQPLAQELQRALPGHTVQLLPMTLTELDSAAKQKQLDLVLTNPEHYIFLKNRLSLSAIATLINLESGRPVTHFAGVIFTRANRNDIQTLADLNDKTIASPAEQSLGGYLMQRWELEKNHVTAKAYSFVGMPQDRVVEAVLAGSTDAGFVRSGLLEKLAKAGKISLNEIRVLVQHNSGDIDQIPFLHSTEHYPEWPMSVASQLSSDTVRKISLALLNIQSDSLIAKTAEIAGFNPPADYTPVEVLMLRLRSHPEELKYFNFSDVAWRYHDIFVIGTAIIWVILILVGFLVRTNRRFKRVASENQKLLLAVEQSPVSIVITDLNGRIEYANHAFVEITGYQLNEVIGKNPRILQSGKVDQSLYEEMWSTLKKGEKWRGEMINRRKNGQEYIELCLINPVKLINGRITHYLGIKQDITERKKTEEQIKQLAFYDPLTGLPNRRKLLDRLHYTTAISHRENRVFAVFMMDLDKFKAVNDALGHAAGDGLLKQVATRITRRLRESDMVARLGGDEFVIVLENLHSPDDAAQVALDVIEDLTVPFELLDGHIVQIGASIGIGFYPQHGDNPEKLLDHADTALYQAKDKGRGCFVYYDTV